MANQLVSYLEFFQSINDDDKVLITKAFESRSFTEGNHLFYPDHICKELFFICKGILRIVVQNEKGNEVIHYFLKENQFCTILKSFNNQTKAAEGIQAACNVEVLAISKPKLLDLYERLPYLKGLLDQITQQALLDKIELRNSYLGLDSTARYKLFIMQQADVAMRVPLSDVASYLGITQQSLSRIRKNIR
ncbi:MAG: Crp/Fnr family transcriptional regulator [Mucilaginibacter sp.]|nr:Crp/Fnr family transcriptional regulator [Mucilaginibacter sp.]